MTTLPASKRREQTPGEEVANTISHGLACLAAIVCAPFLIGAALSGGDTASVVGMIVFAISVVLLYGTSAAYHAIPHGDLKHTFRLLDHAAIFLLIAGTYTPFTLGILRGTWGWILFGLVWSLCIAGILVEILGRLRYSRTALILYIAAGWTVLVAIRPMWLATPTAGLALLFAGGAAYTGGIVFYKMHRPYCHVLWHVCVMIGTTCHGVAVYRYAV